MEQDILAQAAEFYKTAPQKVDAPPTAQGGGEEEDILAYAAQSAKANPIDKVTARSQAQSAGFAGESQYDDFLAFGSDQGKLRARNQPWYDQLGNQAGKLVPSIALGIVEQVGYLGELFDFDKHDYTNAFTEFAKKNRQGIEEALPIYRENPEQIFDLGDSGWWMQHGEGLAESIGEFLVLGAGVGGALGKSAKGLAAAMKAGAFTEGALNASAQLGTSAFLAYTEGAMSGSDIYAQVLNEVNNPQSELFNNPELAQQKASEAAAHTVRLNTVINTLLNFTSVAPMFKKMGAMKSVDELGLGRFAGENRSAWLQRLNKLEAEGVPQASLRKALLLEAGQEGLEEEVNLFAEGEGRVKGGVQSDKGGEISRFFDTVFSEEGALSGILGAVGGVGQTAGMELIPFRNYTDETGKKSWVNNRTLENLHNTERQGQIIHTLKEDISYLNKKQQELNTALQANDQDGVERARQGLFELGALKAVREGIGEEFSEDLEQIAKTDNTKIEEDGNTAAMRMGYASDRNDNEYKTTAQQKIRDIKTLTKDYENIRRMFPTKFVADEVFRKRMQVYGFENYVEGLHKANTEITSELLKMTRSHNILVDDHDAAVSDLVSKAANIKALDAAVTSLEADKDADPRLANNLKNVLLVEKHVHDEQMASLPKEAQDRVKANQGIISQLALARVALLPANEELTLLKADYNKVLENPSQTNSEITKAAKAFVDKHQKKIEKKQKDTKVKEEKAKEKADKAEAKAKKVAKKAPVAPKVVGDYTIAKNANGKYDITDNKAGAIVDTVDSEEQATKWASDNSEAAPQDNTPPPPPDNLEPDNDTQAEPDPIIINEPKPKQVDTSYQGKTEADQKQEVKDVNEVLENALAKSTTANKVAYRARENDNTEDVQDKFRLIHSSTIKVGTPIVLRVDKTNPAYREGSVKVEEVEEAYNETTQEDRVTWDSLIKVGNSIVFNSDGEIGKITRLQDMNGGTRIELVVGTGPNSHVDSIGVRDNEKADSHLLYLNGKGTGKKVTTITTKTRKVKKEVASSGNTVADAPIGIYTTDGKLLGYVPLNAANNATLQTVREAVLKQGEVKTKISDKAPGRLNWSKTKRSVSDAIPTAGQFVIGKDGNIWTGPMKPYQTKGRLWNNLDKVKDGFPYVIIPTPDGNEFALPIDLTKVSENASHDFVTSVMHAFRIYLDGNNEEAWSPQEKAIFDQIFKDYDIDLRTAEGFSQYFKFFFYNYNLNDPERVADNQKDTNDRRWVQWDFNGIRFMKSGGAVEYKGALQSKKVGRDSVIKDKKGRIDPVATEQLREGLMAELMAHLQEMYFNIDLQQLQDNQKVNLPVLRFDEAKDTLVVDQYKAANYQEHLKSITQTKAVGFKATDKEYAYFVSPQTYFDTTFLGKEEQQKYGKPLEKPAESTTLKVNPEVPSMTKRLGRIKFAGHGPVDADVTKEALKYCT